MIAVDTSFIVAYALAEHPNHAWARQIADEALQRQEPFAICTQAISEFIHAATDPRRFTNPLTMQDALKHADEWLSSTETEFVGQDALIVATLLDWMTIHRLGRKRILDSLIAATYAAHGIAKIATLNTADFRVFGVFEFVSPPST